MPIYKDIVYFDWTVVFTIVNTGIMFLLLKHFLYDKVKKVLSDRENEVSKIYEDAEAANRSAMEMKENYEMQLATAREQAGDIMKSATERGQLKYDELLSDAQVRANETLLRATEQVSFERKKAVKEVKDEMAELAVAAAEQVIKKNLDKASQQRLVEDFIENVDKLN